MKKILMATDLSARCDRAMQRAVALADELKAELQIIHIVEESLFEFVTTQHEAAARKAIEQQIGALPQARSLKITPHIMRGLDYEDIIRQAEAYEADLIVLGIHRHDRPEMFRGTTAERVVRYGSVPVLVVKDFVVGPYRRAVVAVDLSSHARAALDMAARLAPRGIVHLVHVAHRPFIGFLGQDSQNQLIRDERTRVTSVLNADITRLSDELGDAAPQFEVLLREGEASGTIRENVANLKPDLLAVGTHGRTGIAHAILGSVAEDLLANAPVDVLTVKEAVGVGR